MMNNNSSHERQSLHQVNLQNNENINHSLPRRAFERKHEEIVTSGNVDKTIPKEQSYGTMDKTSTECVAENGYDPTKSSFVTRLGGLACVDNASSVAVKCYPCCGVTSTAQCFSPPETSLNDDNSTPLPFLYMY